ncbi:Gfo/Idh/MocA family oxidoreductase [candidate division KSB1 bacterium]|nr:Gfo/Idh/MocA family oxidoreductase [candidate division KSB1 bacterium]
MAKKVKIAMLGCGAVADLYLPAFRFLQCAEIRAAIDIDLRMVQEMAGRYNIPQISNDASEAAQSDDIDAVIIGTPPDLHAAHAELFAANGKHILCEKPMASTVQDCQRIIDACKANGVKLQMGHMKRFMRGNQKVKAIIDSGALGKIFMAECHWDCAVPQLIGTYREQKVTAGGSLQDHGPHAFDLIRWWTGNDILEVSASIRSVHPNRPTEDTAAVILEHENGMFSCHHLTRISYGREHGQDTYRIYGTEGTLVVRNDHHFPTMSLESPEIILYRAGDCIQRFDTHHGWNIDDSVVMNFPFYNQLEAFCECIINDTEPRVTGEDGMHVLEAVIAAYVSSLKGMKIKLPFRENIDLTALFEDVKKRDAANLKYDYTIEPKAQPPLSIPEHFIGSRPPRTKETWSSGEHGLVGKVWLEGLMRRLRKPA